MVFLIIISSIQLLVNILNYKNINSPFNFLFLLLLSNLINFIVGLNFNILSFEYYTIFLLIIITYKDSIQQYNIFNIIIILSTSWIFNFNHNLLNIFLLIGIFLNLIPLFRNFSNETNNCCYKYFKRYFILINISLAKLILINLITLYYQVIVLTNYSFIITNILIIHIIQINFLTSFFTGNVENVDINNILLMNTGFSLISYFFPNIKKFEY